MDYETFGEHQWVDTGILEFMRYLPGYILERGDFDFRTPLEIARNSPLPNGPPVAELDIPRTFSWADAERDLSAWLDNPMQKAAHQALYDLLPRVRATAGSEVRGELLETWRRLSTSDHVYYMSTKFFSDQDVHEYFSPYSTPHDAFVNFMNILDDFERRVERGEAPPRAASAGADRAGSKREPQASKRRKEKR
jgi:alpha-amylase